MRKALLILLNEIVMNCILDATRLHVRNCLPASRYEAMEQYEKKSGILAAGNCPEHGWTI